jgi:hypothetical protein
MNTEVICAEPKVETIDKLWPHVVKYFADALVRSKSDYPISYIYDHLRNGTALLWMVVHRQSIILGACTTEIVEKLDGTRTLLILAFGSEHGFRFWKQWLGRLEDYARDENCKLIRLYGRHGWGKVLREYGYSQPWIALEKRVE